MVVLAPMLVMSGISVGLALILVLADKYLADYGECTITINNDKELTMAGGISLLQALADEKIFIPSACGGRGTCAYCLVTIPDMTDPLLPPEKSLLTPEQIRNKVRMSCQIKVRGNLDIEIPEEFFAIKQYETTVRSNTSVATFIRETVFDLPEGEELVFKPGHYIQIHVPSYSCAYKNFGIEDEYRDDWEKFGFLNLEVDYQGEEIMRAYSMANHPAEANMVKLNTRIAVPPQGQDVPAGLGSSYIYNMKPGDKVTMSGPYGDFMINETDREMIYLGGGAGMAPMRSHLFHLFKTLKTQRKVSFWYGARSVREIFYDDEFQDIAREFDNFRFEVALSDKLPEDNWDGPEGFIHQVCFDLYLKNHPDPKNIEYYLCGPPMMVDAVIDMLEGMDVPDEMIRFDKF